MKDIRKLTTWQEWLEADRLIATSFLHEWDEKKAEEQFKQEASGEKPRTEETWGLFDDDGRMTSAIVTSPRRLTFDGRILDLDELHMVGSLPEARGGGSIRRMMEIILREFKEKGNLFAVLMPFSFAFYRKFGFEMAATRLQQKARIEQFRPFQGTYRVKQVLSQEDTNEVRRLYETNMLQGNFCDVKDDQAWQYRGNGEFGQRDWWFADKQKYTYLFYDGDIARAYLTFIFKHGPEGPFTGSMEVSDLVFDSPEALKNVFAFIYGMRAKITDVNVTLPRELDLALLLPEGDDVERKLTGHMMARVLNVEKVLQAMRHPAGDGSYRLLVEDTFLPENTGTYEVAYSDGQAVSVQRTSGEADLSVTVETFAQLALGLTDLAAALYRDGTSLSGNEEVLQSVFVKKRVEME